MGPTDRGPDHARQTFLLKPGKRARGSPAGDNLIYHRVASILPHGFAGRGSAHSPIRESDEVEPQASLRAALLP